MDLHRQNVNSARDSRLSLDDHWAATDAGFQQILARHLASLKNLSYAQQFDIITGSFLWPAEDLLTLLQNPVTPTDLATMTDENGKTILHWAAEHYGLMLASTHGLEQATGYKRLVLQLLRMGCNVHSLQTSQQPGTPKKLDPFLAFMAGASRSWRRRSSEEDMAMIVGRWGETLSEGGISLPVYAATTNRFLRTIWLPGVIMSVPTGYWFSMELVVTSDLELVLWIVRADQRSVRRWTAEPLTMPGSWPIPIKVPNTIIWNPDPADERVGYRWVPDEPLWMFTNPYLPRKSKPEHPSQLRSPDDEFHHARELLFRKSRDDHDPIALMIIRAMSPHRQDRMNSRLQRSASAPPPSATGRDFAIGEYGEVFDEHHPPEGKTEVSKCHHCPFDGRWTANNTFDDLRSDRRCMQGICIAYADSRLPRLCFSSWEIDLFCNPSNVKTVMHFAERFYPEYLHIVKETEKRAKQQAKSQVARFLRGPN